MQYIEEKLSAKDPASKWVSDFVHSDNPKFEGKNKKQRIKMALGAYYAAKRGTSLDEETLAEEVEQIDEASLMRQFRKNENDNAHTENAVLLAKHFGTPEEHNAAKDALKRRNEVGGYDLSNKTDKKHYNVVNDIHKKYFQKLKKSTNEEVEQIDEANMRFDYEAAARPTSRDVKNFQNRDKNPRAAAWTSKYIRRMTKLGGLGPKQTKKDTLRHMQDYFGEEVEQIDEVKGGRRWMLRADPKLANEVEAATNRRKKINYLMRKFGGLTGGQISAGVTNDNRTSGRTGSQ